MVRELRRAILMRERQRQLSEEADSVIEGRDIEIKLRLVLWSGENIPSLLESIQHEIRDRVLKIIGSEGRLEILCDVTGVEESQLGIEERAVGF